MCSRRIARGRRAVARSVRGCATRPRDRETASRRATVATTTEVHAYLRLLYASVGTPHCPQCGRAISRQTPEQIVERILSHLHSERVTVFAPIVRGRKGEFREELDELDQQGFRARIDGEMRDLTDGIRLEKRKNHTVEAIVDRIILKPIPGEPGANGAPKYDTRRLETSVLKALSMANGLVLIGIQGVAETIRAYQALRTGVWPPRLSDVEETETILARQSEL